MNIFINGRFLTQSITGVQRYAIELVRCWDRLLEENTEDQSAYSFTLLVPPHAKHRLDLKHIRQRQVGRLGGYAWEQLVLPFYARQGMLINLCNTGPVWTSNQIATLHDAAVFEHPKSYSFLFRQAYKVIQTMVGARSQKILTGSQFAKAQLVKHCKISESKINVVALGKEHIQRLNSEPCLIDRYGLADQQYVLAVSSMNPSKNFPALVKAIEALQNTRYQIVIAGAMNGKVFNGGELPHSDKIMHVGYVSDMQLKALYAGAACFIFPSKYEGFGLTPLEAMTCGTPVIVSHAASLPEVCGDAVVYCDPDDPHDIARKIERVMTDDQLRRELSVKGLRRAGGYSWHKCAQQTWDVIKEVVQA